MSMNDEKWVFIMATKVWVLATPLAKLVDLTYLKLSRCFNNQLKLDSLQLQFKKPYQLNDVLTPITLLKFV